MANLIIRVIPIAEDEYHDLTWEQTFLEEAAVWTMRSRRIVRE